MADPSNYLIAGNIPFGPGGNPFLGAQTGLGGIANQYQQGYGNALEQNKAMYGDIMAGYQQTSANQVNAQNALAGGYTSLYNNVLGGIQGIGASQQQAIQDTYAQQRGSADQSLISRGLGNTTVRDSVQRGLTLDEGKANIALANQIAALNAGYQSNLGLAGLNYGNQAAAQNTGQANSQLGFMNSITAKYPDAGQYNSLFSQQGQWQQAQADRALTAQLAQKGRAGVGAGAAPSGAGFKAGGSGGASGGFGLYSHALMPQTAGGGNYGNEGAGAIVYPSYGAGIQQPWPSLEQQPQYDTYDVNTQQGYNTNDPGFQAGQYGAEDLNFNYDAGDSGWF